MLKNVKSVVSIILIALISSVKILSDFIQVGASSDFFNAEYWQTTIRDNLLLVIVLFLASSVRKDKAKAKNAEYTELRKALSEAFLSLKSKKLIKRFEQYIDEDNLITGAYNIKEPKGEIINPEILDLIYIPALMANRAGYRLGYGKGFYDRFFANNKIKAKKVIVLASELINDAFKENNFDYKCDEIITA